MGTSKLGASIREKGPPGGRSKGGCVKLTFLSPFLAHLVTERSAKQSVFEDFVLIIFNKFHAMNNKAKNAYPVATFR